MKNYIIGLLLVIILVFASLFYKEKTRLRYAAFPVIKTKGNDSANLHLYVFFSKQNCTPCLEYIKGTIRGQSNNPPNANSAADADTDSYPDA